MSEQKRSTLTPFGKSDKKSNKSPRKTIRLSFTLSDPNENSCPVFDYAASVKSEERKLLKKHREEKDRKPNGFVDPFEDDDEDVKRLAQKFEAKYGDKKKLKSYAELGAGYDETDPFIDNTDAYDEALQEDLETACGGYYINSGPLELKRVEVSDNSDADEVKKRGSKRLLSVINEEEDEEEEENEDEKEEEEEEGGEEEAREEVESKSVVEEGPPEPKKTKVVKDVVEPEKPPTPSFNGLDDKQLVKKKKKKKKRALEDDYGEGSISKSKKPKTVKDLLEEKRIHEQPPKLPEEPKKQIASGASIEEAIESVVNAGNVHDENSNSSHSVHSAASASSVTDDSQDGNPTCDNSPPPLPDNLSAEVAALVTNIKQAAVNTDNTRKSFCTEINNWIIKLEWKTREFSAASRSMLYTHLAHHLPCTKDTLMRRAKKLFVQKEEGLMENLICKLKATIDATMPVLLEDYGKECQRIAEEQGLPVNDVNKGGDENQQTSSPPSSILPKKRFTWTEETRGYLQNITRCKLKCFKISKPRKSTWEEYIQDFLNSRIKSLWPVGWMRTSILIKEIKRSPKHRGKSEASCANMSTSFSSTSSNSSLYVSTSMDTSEQVTKLPSVTSTPLSSKTGADPIKTTPSYSPQNHPKRPNSSSHHQPVKAEKPETFSMDCLLKRTSESVNTPDYNTTLSDLMKQEGVIMNGASLPLKNVNSSQKNDRSEKILDLSSCNSSVSVTPSVIQSATSERTTVRNSENVRVSSAEKTHNYSSSPTGKEAMSNVPLNRKQRLLQVSSQSDRHSETLDVSVIKMTDSAVRCQMLASAKSKSGVSERASSREGEVDKETTTATDILNQIISDSLRSPPYSSAPAKTMEEMKGQGVHKDQELLFDDVMQELKELNHLSSGGRDSKNSSFTGASWSYPVKPMDTSKASPYHAEYLNYISNSPKDTSVAASTPLSYSRHNSSSYDNNSVYVNELNKPMYSHSPHRTSQSLPTHTSSAPSSNQMKMSQMKNIPTSGISSGLPHRYMGQMDYSPEDPHMMIATGLQYGLNNWPYTGSESESHQ